jgi:hypothetical protein
MLSHLFHTLAKGSERAQQRRVFEILEYLLPVLDRIGVVQRGVKEGFYVVVPSACGDRINNLVEIQISKKGRLSRRCPSVLASCEEDALKRGSIVRQHRSKYVWRSLGAMLSSAGIPAPVTFS